MKSMLILFSSLLFLTHNDGYKTGVVATDFSLPNVDAKMVSLADYDQANGFIVIFNCNSCPYSIAYEDRINALDAQYKPKGYPVIAINPNNPAAKDGEQLTDMKQGALKKGLYISLFTRQRPTYLSKIRSNKHPPCIHLRKTRKRKRGTVYRCYR